MARKGARQRISYVLPLANQKNGHRLGVNGLAVDSDNSILYTGGRDGQICAWDLNLDLNNPTVSDYDAKLPPTQPSAFRRQVQAHTHWINDIALAQQNHALVSASSDITVKLWRPDATDGQAPQTLGLHGDYVKKLAVPSLTSDWIASGGLDRKINLWDLNGGGKKLSIDVSEDEAGSLSSKEKGSVYALAATSSMLASGGPESTVRVWDSRTGKRITKLVGHTDNVRDVLISQDGMTIMTASSDRTVKVWSTMAGRCMFTLTMHDASVWSLFSSDPDLSIFYSSDKNGLIVKTDTRNTIELDEGLSIALAQEHEGVQKLVSAGDYLWTATSRPSINRWRDVNTENLEIEIPPDYTSKRASISSTKVRTPTLTNQIDSVARQRSNSGNKKTIPLKHMLRMSNTAYFPTSIAVDSEKRGSMVERGGDIPETIATQAIRLRPDYEIEGQNGLIKYEMLNDRKRVLTLDTAGEVVMWDLLRCCPIKSLGKRDIEEAKDELTTDATVAHWCHVDVRTGNVAVTLEEHNCFDAEMYADELDLEEDIEFREDQRINLGKWVLRYLFSNLITEEIGRDQNFRKQLLTAQEDKRLQRESAPSSILLPQNVVNGWHGDSNGPPSASTLRPTNGIKPTTPGLAIGQAPASNASPAKSAAGINALSVTTEENGPTSQPRQSADRTSSDYFTSVRPANDDLTSPTSAVKSPITPGESAVADDSTPPAGEGGKETPGKDSGLFGKKFSMRGMSFTGMKKMGRSVTGGDKDKPAAVEEKEEGAESDSRSSKTSNSRSIDDNLFGTIQKIRYSYEDSVQQQIQSQQAHENGLPVPPIKNIDIPSAITPSLPAETPVIKPPLNTTILIQEDRPEAGDVADLFEGTVGRLGEMCDAVEKAAPMWLGDVLLRNQIPQKDILKISFILEPQQGSGLPTIAADGNNRLNANRMLRAKKILGYVAERIEPAPSEKEAEKQEAEGGKMKPEEYLELLCQGQVVPPTMTLATIRAHLWRGGGDIILYYKANGKKAILHAQPQTNIPTTPRPAGPAEGGDGDANAAVS